MATDIGCYPIFRFMVSFILKERKNNRRILNNGTKNKTKGHRHGFNGDSVL